MPCYNQGWDMNVKKKKKQCSYFIFFKFESNTFLFICCGRFLCVALDSLRLSMKTRLTSDSQKSTCLCPLRAEIEGECHHNQPIEYIFTGVCFVCCGHIVCSCWYGAHMYAWVRLKASSWPQVPWPLSTRVSRWTSEAGLFGQWALKLYLSLCSCWHHGYRRAPSPPSYTGPEIRTQVPVLALQALTDPAVPLSP